MFPLNRPINDWRHKRVWIVGASSGIGAALAKEALAAGALVALSARRKEALEEIAGAEQNALPVQLDVLDDAAWTSAYQEIRNHFDGIDLVIFCAADYRPERSWEVIPSGAKRTLSVNVGSIYSGLAIVLPEMILRGSGGIALVASVAGYIGLPKASVYGPSKAALINLAEILYSDLHPKGLDVYLINPGFVRTQLTARNDFKMPALQTAEAAARTILKGISAGRFEIHFPWRFTVPLKLMRMLPYRLRFALIGQLVKT
jgi:short-subunit dehydrogenase